MQPIDPAIASNDPAAPTTRRRWGTIAAGVLAVGAAGTLLFLAMGDSASQGAGSPKAAVEQLAAAINAEDFAAAIDALAPDEVDGLQPLIDAFRTQAQQEGIQGLAKGEGLDLQLTATTLNETSLGDDAVLVGVDGTIAVSTDGMDGPLGGLIGEGQSESFDVDLVVIRLNGGWYVSPALTLGNYIVQDADLPAGNFDVIDTPSPVVRPSSPAEAVEQFTAAIATQDLDVLVDVMGTGEARFLRVFRDAADELLAERNFSVSVDEVLASNAPGGASLERLRLSVVAPDGTMHIARYTAGCLSVDDDDRDCPLDDDVQERLGITEADLVFQVVQSGGNLRVSMMRSITALAGKAVDNISRSDVLSTFGLEVFDDPVLVEPGTPTKGTIGDAGYALYEFQAAAGVEYSVSVGDNCYGDRLTPDDTTGSWSYDDPSNTEGRPVRVVVRCYDSPNFTLEVLEVATIETAFPVDVEGELPAGGAAHYTFDVPDSGYYELIVEGNVSAYVASSLSTSAEGYVELSAGPNQIDVYSYGNAATFRLQLSETEPAPAPATGLQFEDGSMSITIDLSNGSVTVPYFAEGGTNIIVSAFPDSLQDITLTANDCSDCGVLDQTGPGASEAQRLNINGVGVGQHSVTIAPYSSVDEYGTVTITLEYDFG